MMKTTLIALSFCFALASCTDGKKTEDRVNDLQNDSMKTEQMPGTGAVPNMNDTTPTDSGVSNTMGQPSGGGTNPAAQQPSPTR